MRTTPRLRNAEVQRLRYEPGRSLLLFLTDRCPVGCGHCSVDSRPDSPKITDYALLERLLDGICSSQERDLVGISGGEPFVERRGLTLAVTRLSAANKMIVVYTSGVWARTDVQPAWITELLPKLSCVFLSTDAFHQSTVERTRFGAAARAVVDAGVPLVVQVLDEEPQVEAARTMLERALGPLWTEMAELNRIPKLAYGRAAGLFDPAPPMDAKAIGPCRSLASPVVRYDGRISACCNEPVIMARGPDRLRRTVVQADQVLAALDELAADPLLAAIASVGGGAVTALPGFARLADSPVRGICDLCWRLQEAAAPSLEPNDERVLRLLPMVVRRHTKEVPR